MARHGPEPFAVRPFMPEDRALRAQGLPDEVRVPRRVEVGVDQVDLVERDSRIRGRHCDPHDNTFPSLLPGSEPYRQALWAVHDNGTQHYRRTIEFDPLGATRQLLVEKPQLGPGQNTADAEMFTGA
jgi:hypothetical protein